MNELYKKTNSGNMSATIAYKSKARQQRTNPKTSHAKRQYKSKYKSRDKSSETNKANFLIAV